MSQVSAAISGTVDCTFNPGNTVSASFEDSHKATHVVNNPKLNYSSLFPITSSYYDTQGQKDSVGSVFRDYSDPFSKSATSCQPCVRLPVWTLMSGNRTVQAETVMTELC